MDEITLSFFTLVEADLVDNRPFASSRTISYHLFPSLESLMLIHLQCSSVAIVHHSPSFYPSLIHCSCRRRHLYPLWSWMESTTRRIVSNEWVIYCNSLFFVRSGSIHFNSNSADSFNFSPPSPFQSLTLFPLVLLWLDWATIHSFRPSIHG